ncbi:hypothetical protein CQW23_19557 [Capsicum baccatum]|uniref:Uncharacterized protein n=1 Tax=Capsicum baccatum TaxID=33114 RepID=A0A2G2W644_CAPBA|nr:hypothetical protein CQW23_19557 [Capsicum baccatum]
MLAYLNMLQPQSTRASKQRDSAIQKAHLWHSEIVKAGDQAVILEGAVVRAEEKVRLMEVDTEAQIREACRGEA